MNAVGYRLKVCPLLFAPTLHRPHKSHKSQFKKHRDNNRLKREMEGNQKRLREIQGDQVAYSYLSQFSSPARGRALVGLGQVGLTFNSRLKRQCC